MFICDLIRTFSAPFVLIVMEKNAVLSPVGGKFKMASVRITNTPVSLLSTFYLNSISKRHTSKKPRKDYSILYTTFNCKKHVFATN